MQCFANLEKRIHPVRVYDASDAGVFHFVVHHTHTRRAAHDASRNLQSLQTWFRIHYQSRSSPSPPVSRCAATSRKERERIVGKLSHNGSAQGPVICHLAWHVESRSTPSPNKINAMLCSYPAAVLVEPVVVLVVLAALIGVVDVVSVKIAMVVTTRSSNSSSSSSSGSHSGSRRSSNSQAGVVVQW